MAREIGKITFTETDSGYLVEVAGKELKDLFSCCCLPVTAVRAARQDCCPPESQGKDCCPPESQGKDCCPPGKPEKD